MQEFSAKRLNRKERLVDFYEARLALDNISLPIKELEYLAVGWRSEASAIQTYKAATSYPFRMCRSIESVLDVGSGLGGLLTYLRDSIGFKGKYLGIEILESFDSYARKLHREDALASFACEDFLSFSPGSLTFDWAFSLGSLSVHQEDQENENKMTVQKMAAMSLFGFSVFLNNADKCKNLKGHNIDDFVNMASTLVPDCKEINVDAFGGIELPAKTMVHILKKKT